jgi:hypothetical protein
VSKRRKHNRVALVRTRKIYVILCYIIVVHASRKLGIDIVIMKITRSTKRYTEICIQCISTPERPSTTFDFNVIQPTRDARSFVAVQTNSKGEVGDDAKLTPAVVDSRLCTEIIAL